MTRYNPTLPINLAADASTEKPISFASRTLTTAEKNYSQLEKEALFLIFGVCKFHKYLYGRKFTLITDNTSLTAIIASKKGIPSLAAARLQRWALLLSGYDYNICFKPTESHSNADGLSRLPLHDQEAVGEMKTVTILNLSQIQALPVACNQVHTATRRDPILSKIVDYVRRGWPKQVPDNIQPYQSKQEEITIESGCKL